MVKGEKGPSKGKAMLFKPCNYKFSTYTGKKTRVDLLHPDRSKLIIYPRLCRHSHGQGEKEQSKGKAKLSKPCNYKSTTYS